VPFVGDADSSAWIAALDKLTALNPKVLIPGHGAPSRSPRTDLAFTRDYLNYLRTQMGQAARDLVPFEEAYEKIDWSKYRSMPAFHEATGDHQPVSAAGQEGAEDASPRTAAFWHACYPGSPVYAVYTAHSPPRSRNRVIKRDNRRQ
jgi:hypothetical protein